MSSAKKSSSPSVKSVLFQQLTTQYVLETAIRHELPKLKKAANAKIKEKFLEKAKVFSSRLEVQGDLAKLLEEEQSEIDWKAVIY